MLSTVTGSSLGFLDASLQFLDFCFKEFVAMFEGGNLFLFGEILLFKLLDLLLLLFDLGLILIRLDAESIHFLLKQVSSRHGGLIGVMWVVW